MIQFVVLFVGLFGVEEGAVTSVDDGDYIVTPGGYFHKSCIHQWGNNVHIINQKGTDYIFDNGDLKEQLEACPYPWFPLKNVTLPSSIGSEDGYYSGWIEFAGFTNDKQYTFMTSTWSVPAFPQDHTILTTLFFFNGMENYLHNTSGILQPVLALGTSGCSIFTWDTWYIASFLVSAAGRAHCGSSYDVNPGDLIRGNLSLSNSGSNSWLITTEVLPTGGSLAADPVVSSLSTTFEGEALFACLTFEGIRVYGCADYPTGSKNVFYDVHLLDETGELNPAWEKTVNFHDCGQDVQFDGNTIAVIWNETAL